MRDLIMPVVRISDATFQRAQKYAVPLVDSFDSLMNKLLDTVEAVSKDRTVNALSLPASPIKNPNSSHAKPESVGTFQIEARETGNGRYKCEVNGDNITAFLKAVGYLGYSAEQAWTLLAKLGLGGGASGKEVSPMETGSPTKVSWHTVTCQVSAGKQIREGKTPHHGGEKAELTEKHETEIERLIGKPKNSF